MWSGSLGVCRQLALVFYLHLPKSCIWLNYLLFFHLSVLCSPTNNNIYRLETSVRGCIIVSKATYTLHAMRIQANTIKQRDMVWPRTYFGCWSIRSMRSVENKDEPEAGQHKGLTWGISKGSHEATRKVNKQMNCSWCQKFYKERTHLKLAMTTCNAVVLAFL